MPDSAGEKEGQALERKRMMKVKREIQKSQVGHGSDVECQTLFSELPSMHRAKIERIGPLQARVLEDVTLFGVRVPKNFQTDGASVPRYLWWIMSPFTEGLYAALVHDFMLQRNGLDPIFRKQADRNFYYNLRSSEGLNIARCFLAWVGVRWWSRQYVRLMHAKERQSNE